jgi:hypothetical protein
MAKNNNLLFYGILGLGGYFLYKNLNQAGAAVGASSGTGATSQEVADLRQAITPQTAQITNPKLSTQEVAALNANTPKTVNLFGVDVAVSNALANKINNFSDTQLANAVTTEKAVRKEESLGLIKVTTVSNKAPQLVAGGAAGVDARQAAAVAASKASKSLKK